MRRLLGTIFLFAFLVGVLISGTGCGKKGDTEGEVFSETKIPKAADREAEIDEILGEGG